MAVQVDSGGGEGQALRQPAARIEQGQAKGLDFQLLPLGDLEKPFPFGLVDIKAAALSVIEPHSGGGMFVRWHIFIETASFDRNGLCNTFTYSVSRGKHQ